MSICLFNDDEKISFARGGRMLEKAIVFTALVWLFFIFIFLYSNVKNNPQCLLSKDPILCVEIVKNKEK